MDIPASEYQLWTPHSSVVFHFRLLYSLLKPFYLSNSYHLHLTNNLSIWQSPFLGKQRKMQQQLSYFTEGTLTQLCSIHQYSAVIALGWALFFGVCTITQTSRPVVQRQMGECCSGIKKNQDDPTTYGNVYICMDASVNCVAEMRSEHICWMEVWINGDEKLFSEFILQMFF